ncbi:transcriptional repressor [Nakamurella sp. YIM 132087]|uniref:Transcriptional repressor n=1 Tax=Nakamurella alba TaxID=2665158 RepID=A0A7K1FG29_9ACTN|nr:Fur family transcriptional regulator [Nakamurella alba]MTD13020.1 transcriptional repressor [Nakamurella alba]
MPTLTERLTTRGWRMTPQRRVISALFDVSASQHVHLTADDVLEQAVAVLPDISRATVYNTLGELVDAGELLAVSVGDRITRYDPNVHTEHHHLVCTGCGAIFDVPALPVPPPSPGGEAGGFVVEAAEVIYRGRCARCAGQDA